MHALRPVLLDARVFLLTIIRKTCRPRNRPPDLVVPPIAFFYGSALVRRPPAAIEAGGTGVSLAILLCLLQRGRRGYRSNPRLSTEASGRPNSLLQGSGGRRQCV